MAKTYIRERQILCGERYKEVDIYSISERDYRRAKKSKPSRPAQVKLNDKNAAKHLNRIALANFSERALCIHLTYSDRHLPKDPTQAARDFRNYIRRVNYELRKRGKPPARYVGVTAGDEPDPADKRKKGIRWHHHLIIECELTRDELEALWRTSTGQKLGYSNAERLEFAVDGLVGLCDYLKNQRGKRRWYQSKGLRQPRYPKPNDDKYTHRQLDRICRSTGALPAYWEKKYKGWNCAPCEPIYNELTGWSVHLKLWRIPPKKE